MPQFMSGGDQFSQCKAEKASFCEQFDPFSTLKTGQHLNLTDFKLSAANVLHERRAYTLFTATFQAHRR